MRYAGLKKNDIVDCLDGICVSFWTQGCPFHCEGCHNPGTWDFEGGLELPSDYKHQVIEALCANGIKRDFSVLGGEPLCEQNLELTHSLVCSVRTVYPDIKIYLWTGYTIEHLQKLNNPYINDILSNIDYLMDGPFILEKRDLRLQLVGSSNQRVIQLKDGKIINKNTI